MNPAKFIPTDPNQDPRKTWNDRNGVDSKNEIVEVIARINNLEAWHQLKAVNFRSTIPQPPGEWNVTAQISSDQLDFIRKLTFVISLEWGRLITPAD